MDQHVRQVPWLGDGIGGDIDVVVQQVQGVRRKLYISPGGIDGVDAHDFVLSLVYEGRFLPVVDRLILEEWDIAGDIIALKKPHIQLVPDFPPLVLRHIFADEADLRAAGILLRGDQPPL